MSNPAGCRLFLIICAVALLATSAFGGSQARIVRLSDVQGTVQIDKNSGLGFENAFVNLPIVQGTQLKTGGDGRAEIEFEDGSSMRLAHNTSIEFSTLGLSDSGKRLSQVNLTDGMAYVNWLGKSGDQFALNFAHEKITLDRAAHFRVDASQEIANLAVFKGDVDVEGPTGKVTVEKKKTATFDISQDDKSTIANKVTEAPLDSWDKEASAYHDEYAKNNSSPYGYGASDLGYYGSYTSVPGYGMMWQPYFTGIGWDPFMDGAWGWYPGFGYMFASAYPWGWLPYRYGSWMFVPGFGWMWQPGSWNSWVTVPRYVATTTAHVTPLVAPSAGTVKTVAVGRTGWVAPISPNRLMVKSGSAGIGIPRGSMHDLNHVNQQVVKSGFAEVRSAPQFSANSGRASGFGGGHSSMEPTTAHTSSMGHSSSMSHSTGTSHH